MLTDAIATDVASGSYVLHVVPANGGGVDRYVRDICAHRLHDCILHVVPEQCVFEVVALARFFALDQARFSDLSAAQAVGRPTLIHAHSTLPAVRERVGLLSRALGIDYVVTLHDVDFAGAFEAINPIEREARLRFVRGAAHRVVPSVFISDLLTTSLGADVTRECLENGVGVDQAEGETAVTRNCDGPFQIAVVGALGLHKGLNFLLDVVAALPQSVRVVIIGYADGQITPQWLVEGRVWVHGAFQPCELTGLVTRYGAQLAFFPNRQPESYSYSLSDAWLAGLPALGPTSGAIGERIVKTGAGWTYAAEDVAEVVAASVLACLSGTKNVAGNVYRARASLLSIENMVSRLDHLYKKIMSTPLSVGADGNIALPIDALEAIAATHLNSNFFRRELIKLGGDFAFSQSQAANTAHALKSVTEEYDSRGAWIDTLEKALAECKAEIARLESARIAEHAQAEAARLNERSQAEAARAYDRAIAEAARQQERERLAAAHEAALADLRAKAETARVIAHAAYEEYAAKLQQDVNDTLEIAHEQQRRIAIYDQALWMIPAWIQKKILTRAERIVGKKASQ